MVDNADIQISKKIMKIRDLKRTEMKVLKGYFTMVEENFEIHRFEMHRNEGF